MSGLRIVRYHPRAAVGDGGMTGAIRRWSLALAGLGADVTIAFADGEPPADAGPVHWRRVRHVRGGPITVPHGLDHVIQDADVVVLHSGWTAHNAIAARVGRSHGVPYILEPRGAYDPNIVGRHPLRKRAWWDLAERSVVEGALAIHAFFEEERAHLDAIGYRGRIVVAPNGVETPQPIKWIGGGGYLLWTGRFDPEHKGLDVLVDAVAMLAPADRPRVRLHGPDWRGGKARTSRQIAARGLDAWIRVGPPVYGGDKARLLSAADAFLYPSRWDACPNAVLEAVAIGIPTLCGSFPLGSHLARNDAALVSDATVDALRNALIAVRDRERLAAIGATGPEICARDFPWPSVADRWLGQVEDALAHHRPARSDARSRSSVPHVERS